MFYIKKSRRQDPTKQLLYSHQPPIMKTIKIRWTWCAGYCWRSRDELISDVLQWTPSHGRVKAGWSARTYIQQLCANTGCSPEDLLEAMDDREGGRERVRDIRADSATWWWWLLVYLLLNQNVNGHLMAYSIISTRNSMAQSADHFIKLEGKNTSIFLETTLTQTSKNIISNQCPSLKHLKGIHEHWNWILYQ